MSEWSIALLWAALKSAVISFVQTYLGRKHDADSGAAQQRKAQDKVDDDAAADARRRLDEWTKLTPDERLRRFRELDDDGA